MIAERFWTFWVAPSTEVFSLTPHRAIEWIPLFLKVSNRFVLEPVTLSSTYGTMGSTWIRISGAFTHPSRVRCAQKERILQSAPQEQRCELTAEFAGAKALIIESWS